MVIILMSGFFAAACKITLEGNVFFLPFILASKLIYIIHNLNDYVNVSIIIFFMIITIKGTKKRLKLKVNNQFVTQN